MASRALFIITGALAWLGGLGTAFAVSSCDTDTCSAMDPDDPLCRPGLPAGAEDEALAESPDESQASASQRPPTCDRMSRPSVYVVPSRLTEDMVRVVDVETVWYEHEGRTYEARCVQGDPERGMPSCVAWLVGNELEGTFTVSTEYCDTVVSETVKVEKTGDGCHVGTELLLLDVSTLGCLTDRPRPAPPVEPPTDR